MDKVTIDTRAVDIDAGAEIWDGLRKAIIGGTARLMPANIGGVQHTAIVGVGDDGSVAAVFGVLVGATVVTS